MALVILSFEVKDHTFDFEKPVEQQLKRAVNEVVLIDDFDSNELRVDLLKRVWRQIFVPN